MFEQIIMFLIYACLVAAMIYLLLWVIGTVAGVAIPPKVVQILWVVFVLVCLLFLVRIFVSGGGVHSFFVK